jgi:hypothetical protein
MLRFSTDIRNKKVALPSGGNKIGVIIFLAETPRLAAWKDGVFARIADNSQFKSVGRRSIGFLRFLVGVRAGE